MTRARKSKLKVAVTGPTGTFGLALMPLLEEDAEVDHVVGIARRAFDPAEHGWTKMGYRRGDVRDVDALTEAFDGADVVVHLAFLILSGSKDTTRAINVEGTLNAFRAAAAVGAKRFVYASSVAAYGFHRDNPVGMSEDWATRPADRLFYAQEKAELEHLLQQEAAAHPEIDLYLLRPPIVLGPNAVGAKATLPAFLAPLLRGGVGALRRLPGMPTLVPDLPLQLIHHDDVAEALRLCVVGARAPGAYNIAADDVVSSVDVARELGLRPIAIPAGPVRTAARAAVRLPYLPSGAQWVEAMSHPAIMDTTKARTELGWTPRHSAIASLRATLG
ncbi:NAD-dependent epimerase/dehydratase family protein [Nocardioides piscis]|uniref:NAD-dependent epimerase/dehydratase family protein n=1 Tax=Nocardioides piscis TaxID=2714938 RepID=A0A6G7YCX0_9ACTN|nr:NAD-dependent epimerase/dehydratase family protein [Nocardioides piscis]QIK74457.1 NAD-dependent epimerase/dehydratase family protein [Nocardioides piscis]